MTQPIHILHNFYNAGLHHHKDALKVLSDITDLTTAQIQAWFDKQRQNDKEFRNRIPSENMPRPLLPVSSGEGKWTAQKRRILKACFDSGFGIAKYFGLIVAITGLHKAQVSNWVRQRRYHLRKLGQFPPVPGKSPETKWSSEFDKENKAIPFERTAMQLLVTEALKENRKRRQTAAVDETYYPPAKRTRYRSPESVAMIPKQVIVQLENNKLDAWGVHINYHHNELLVTRVDLGFQAHQKGIRIGWRVHRVNELQASPANLSQIGDILARKQGCEFVFKVVENWHVESPLAVNQR